MSCTHHPTCNESLRAARATVKVLTATKREDLLTEYYDVFERLRGLSGEHHIVTDEIVKPVIHRPRRVPVPLRDQIKAKLGEMLKRDIIIPGRFARVVQASIRCMLSCKIV